MLSTLNGKDFHPRRLVSDGITCLFVLNEGH